MESTKDLELDKELVAEEQLEAGKQLEPEEHFELRNELLEEKEYGKYAILTLLVAMSTTKERSSHNRNKRLIEAMTTAMEQVFDSHSDSIRQGLHKARKGKEQDLNPKPPDNSLRSTWSSPQKISHTPKSNSMFYSDYQPTNALLKFSGKRDYIEWEKNMEEWFHDHHILREKRLASAISQLTGDAYKWWVQEVDNRWYNKEPTITSWRDLKELLRNKYAPQASNRSRKASVTAQGLPVQEKEQTLALYSKKNTKAEQQFEDELLKILNAYNKPKKAKSTSQPKKVTEEVVVHKQSLKPSLESSGEPKHCKSSNLSKKVTCYKCRKKGHLAATCPGELELTMTSLESKLSSPNSSSEVDNQGLEHSSSCIMHLFLSKDVDSGHTMEHENDKAKGSTKEENHHLVSTTPQACRADYVSNITIFKAEILPNILRGNQVSLSCEFIQYWNNFTFTRTFKQPVLNVGISSIIHLILSLSAKEDAGTIDVCNDMPTNSKLMTCSLAIKESEDVNNTILKEKEPPYVSQQVLNRELPKEATRELGGFTQAKAVLVHNQSPRAECNILVKEKPPDATPPIKTRGNYLNSQKRMKANLLSLGEGCTIWRPIKKTTDREISTHHRSQSRDPREDNESQLRLKHKEERIDKQSNCFVRVGDVKKVVLSKHKLLLFNYKEALMSLTNPTPVLPSEMMSLLQDYEDMFSEDKPIGLSPIHNASQSYIWRPGDYIGRSRPEPHESLVTLLHMFLEEPKMDLSSFGSFHTYQWRPGELLNSSREEELVTNNALIKEEPPDPTPLPLTVMISSTEHTTNLIKVSSSFTRFVSHVTRTVTMSLSHLGNSEKELELFKENLEPNSCLRTQVKHEHFKDNTLIKVEACLLVYSDSMTMITHLLFAKAVDNIAGIKEEPPDIEVLSSNLFERTGIGVVLMPRIDSPSTLTRRRSDNAYALELQGKYNVSSNFNDSYLVLFIVGELDLRSNPFQVGEDDVTMESTKDLELDKELVAEEQLEAGKQLEPEEHFELRNELLEEKEYGKYAILTLLYQFGAVAGDRTRVTRVTGGNTYHYTTTTVSPSLRNEISSFTQKQSESICEAWERFKGYTIQCPHHGFKKASLLSTLYRGVLPKIRMLLDTASNGNFLNKDVEEGWELIENLALSDGNYNEDFDRSNRGIGDSDARHSKDIKALNDKLDQILLSQQKQVHYITEEEHYQIQEGENTQNVEVSYVQNQGGYNKGYNPYKPAHPNLSYRSTNVANPQDQVYPQHQQNQSKPFIPYNQGFAPKQQFSGGYQQHNPPPGFAQQPQQAPPAQAPDMQHMFQQILQGQAAGTIAIEKKLAEIHNKVDCTFNDLNIKFEALNSRIKYLESQAASTSAPKHPGQLPGKAIQNPKEYVNAIRLRSGRELQTRPSIAPVTEDSEIQEGEDFIQHETQVNDTTKLDQDAAPSDQAKSPQIKEPVVDKSKKKAFIPPPYKPKIPFPGRFKRDIIEKYRTMFAKHIKELEARMPLIDAYKLIPDSHKYLKDMVMERIKEVQGMSMESHECSEIIQTKIIPKKLGDPGSFTLPCSLGSLAFSNCLCDLGAFKSLMPLSVAKRLGFSKFKPCNITLILADESIRFPHGLLEDLPIKIGNAEIPTDFIVLEMDEEPKDPLILGRPFLATAGAVIDVKNGKIDLNLGNDFTMKFDINDATRKPTIEGQTFVVKVMDCLADEQLEEVAKEDHQKTSLTKSGEAGYLLTETLSCGKSLDSHKEVAGSEVLKGLIEPETEVKVAYEASSTHAQPTDSSIHLSKPTTRLENSSSTKHRDKLLESSNSAQDGWLELKERSKWQDKAIRELTGTVRELKDQIKKLHGIANQVPLQIKDVPNDEASTLVSAKGSEITSEWSIEEDYPVARQEAYYEKRTIEYSTANLSREHAKFDDSSTCRTEEISFALYNPP
ncbi:Retrotransposon gag domain [Arabidopsis suecica]|uniref:Retrotransposon gag domain n=1 Tax=Arabidopsis suecica TaxID=45249 RepID=A0A8T2BA59_ARASU|nr:Retrotransposon gag domain [Arabidopsis suecica]